MAIQKRTHMGHSHGHHHHHHDNTYLASTNKNDPGVRITRIGLYVNLGMAVVKGTGGLVFHSQALTADAMHALTDLMSDVLTLATISYSLKPATARFPMGYGKIESLGALAVSSILLAGGVGIGVQAVMALAQQFFPQIFEILSDLAAQIPFLEHAHSHSHSHGVHAGGPHINAAWLAAASIVVKEWLYRKTIKVAREKRSSVLSSNAYHHRVDSLTAFVAFFTIVASNFMEAARWLDPVGGLVIAGMIVQAGCANTKSAFLELADVGVDDDLRESAEKAAKTVLEGHDAQIRGVQGIKSGQNLMLEVEVGVPDNWSAFQLSDAEVQIREAVAHSVKGTRRVNVRFVTKDTTREPFMDQYTTTDRAHIAEEPLDDHDHHHDHHHEHPDGHATATKTNSKAEKRKGG